MDEAREGSGAGGGDMDDGVAGGEEEGGMLAADKATWHKWLSKRESEASREPSTAATLLCAAKLPQMVSEMLKSPDLPPLLTRKLVGLLAQPSVRRAPNVERTDALYRLLLNSALMNGAPPPRSIRPTRRDGRGGGGGGARRRGGGGAPADHRLHRGAADALSAAAGGGGGGGGGAVVSEFLNSSASCTLGTAAKPTPIRCSPRSCSRCAPPPAAST